MAVLLACASCAHFDPVDDLDYAEYTDTGHAIDAILAHEPSTRVFAVGEYHDRGALNPSDRHRSTLDRFQTDVLAHLAPHAERLVIEAWLGESCTQVAGQVPAKFEAATGRTAWTPGDLDHWQNDHGEIELHGLPMTCVEQSAIVDATGRIDLLLLLELVTDKLGETTRALLAMDARGVIVYGGALHNSLYPAWPFENLSYAAPLARELGAGSVLELDLIVPEIVAPPNSRAITSVLNEPWYPLLGRSAPGKTLVWQRGPSSYVVILPAESDAVAAVARPHSPT